MRLLLLLSIFAPCLLGCDHFYAVSGVVRSCADHAPIADAAVTLRLDGSDKHDASRTAADGSFTLVLNEPYSEEPSTVEVVKEGFASGTEHLRGPGVAPDVCLDPLGP